MGNCQAAEAATVVIQHPGNRVERIYWSVSAHEVMSSNPGHYVSVVIRPPAPTTGHINGATPPVKQLKLLSPDDTLVMGQVYRLISFQDVLKEFAAKKCAKLGKLLKQRGGFCLDPNKRLVDGAVLKLNPTPLSINPNSAKIEEGGEYRKGSGSSSSSSGGGVGRHHAGGQWKPALHSIAELGT